MQYSFADIASILAASEKDYLCIEELAERLKRVVVAFSTPQAALRLISRLQKASFVLYYVLTWTFHAQTLGEEHSLIQPVDVSSRTLPSAFIRAVYVLLSAMPVGRSVRTAILPFHLILFYLNGQYLDPVKRLLGIRYIQSAGKRSVKSAQYFLIVCTLVNALMDVKELLTGPGPIERTAPDPTQTTDKKCPLCYGPLLSPAVTPCGHVYCWDCISTWTQRFPSCPMCRAECPANLLYTINL